MTSFTGYVENIKEALFLLDACCNGLLPMRKARLSFKEKMDLNSGAVYIFSQGDTGICRWTDGKFWTPSRFQDGFLVYWELETTPCDSSGNGRPLSAQSTDSGMDTIATKNQKRYRIKQGGLIKKAISIETPYYGTLQLVSYFTELGLLRSPTSFVV